jgi:hypothetical protein
MATRAGMLRFSSTIFLSAFLLFQVQPMMGRYVLPWFGGGPAVWTNCMLFFQVLLLGGYAYAHWLGSLRSARLQVSIHLALLAASLFFLPIGPRSDIWKPASSSDPSGRILLLLAATVGGPYLLLAATGPLLQRWFSMSHSEESPWRLYALSNFGSFLALFSYPFVLEPLLRLNTQVWIWSGLYLAFVALCGWTAWKFRGVQHNTQAGMPVPHTQAGMPVPHTIWTMLFWVGLAAAGSTLLLATTNQISQEIAVIPFLWVLPLSIYLLTFILVFERDRWYHRLFFSVTMGLFAPLACAMMAASVALSFRLQIGAYMVVLFAACMLCHGELARSRPPARHLTAFYLSIAAGGALGGVFAALIAPHLFSGFSEYPIGLAAACFLGFAGWLRTGAYSQWTRGNFAVRIPLMALLLGGLTAVAASVIGKDQFTSTTVRNFYGILRVKENMDANGALRQLTHGTIRHGFQYLRGAKHDWPTSYYGPHSGAGIVLKSLDSRSLRVAVVGLGTGTLAAWGKPGDTFRFYEINPAVKDIAYQWFTYLKDSKAKTEIVLGDARVQMERELANGEGRDFDVIAVDAFSSDAIPLHLLTAECGDIYRRRLAPGGLLLLHISNRSLGLEPVTRGLAQHLGWQAVELVSMDYAASGESSANWVLITGNAEFIRRPEIAGAVVHWAGRERPAITWTDDFASLWHVLKF